MFFYERSEMICPELSDRRQRRRSRMYERRSAAFVPRGTRTAGGRGARAPKRAAGGKSAKFLISKSDLDHFFSYCCRGKEKNQALVHHGAQSTIHPNTPAWHARNLKVSPGAHASEVAGTHLCIPEAEA